MEALDDQNKLRSLMLDPPYESSNNLMLFLSMQSFF